MGTLYHYTSVDGFEGIVKNNAIRMTKSEFLNDPNDCHLFVKLTRKYLDKHKEYVKGLIESLNSNNSEIEELYETKDCDLIRYVEYIQKNIGLYVLSLTNREDEMNMWNYYGHGGIQLKFQEEKLVDSLCGTFVSEKEFLTGANVIYANTELDIEKISVPDFSQFVLMNRESKNIFNEHRAFIKEKSLYEADHLYSISNLGNFINIYLKSYISSLEYLFKEQIINVNTPSNKVFDSIFDNISKLNSFLYWKHDLSLYMLVLSALIKSDTYKYEDEYRIVYFEHSINSSKKKKEEYGVKSIGDNRFLYPYITFDMKNKLDKSLESVVVSPITKNLPIDNTIYCNTLKSFLVSKGLDESVIVEYSKHVIRW